MKHSTSEKHYISKESMRRIARTHFAAVLAQTIRDEYDLNADEATGMAASVIARLEANDTRFEHYQDLEWWFSEEGLCVNVVASRGVIFPVPESAEAEEEDA